MRTGYLRERRHGRRTDGTREAHVFIAFLAYCLHVTLARRLHALAARSVLEKFAAVQMIDLHLPTTDGRELPLNHYTESEPELTLLLNKLKLDFVAARYLNLCIQVQFAADSPLEEAVYCEPVSEVGFQAAVEKAGFQGVMDDNGSVVTLFWARISWNLVFWPRQIIPLFLP
jgi:hypothetical protein